MIPFTQFLEPRIYRRLKKQAEARYITIQELLRAVIIPDWLEYEKSLQTQQE